MARKPNNIDELRRKPGVSEEIELTIRAFEITLDNLTLPPENKGWASTKKVLAQRGLLERMKTFQPELMFPETLQLLQPYLDNPMFMPAVLKPQNRVCEVLCAWVRMCVQASRLNYCIDDSIERTQSARADEEAPRSAQGESVLDDQLKALSLLAMCSSKQELRQVSLMDVQFSRESLEILCPGNPETRAP